MPQRGKIPYFHLSSFLFSGESDCVIPTPEPPSECWIQGQCQGETISVQITLTEGLQLLILFDNKY
jgi:hypothetical protein